MESSIGKSGYIYILSNSSIGNMVKIGRTFRNPEERIKELSGATGVPTPFILEYKQRFNDCVRAESLIHKYLELDNKRVSNKREFFNLNIDEAREVIKMVESKYFKKDKDEDGFRSYLTNWIENDDLGNEVKISLSADMVSFKNKYHEVIEKKVFSDNKEEVRTYLTNDLKAFFGDIIGDEDNSTDEVIENLISQGQDYLEGYGEGIIDIEEGLNYLHKAISMESAKACYIASEYYYSKYLESESLKDLKIAREYLKTGIKFKGNEAIHCLLRLTNLRFYDSAESELNSNIITNNTLAYWGMFFKKIKEIGLNNIDSIMYSGIISSIKELFVNDNYIRSVNNYSNLNDRYKETLKEGIEVIKYCYFDIIRDYKRKKDIEFIYENERANVIKFLKDTFELTDINIDLKNEFMGTDINLSSVEKGNYEITGKMNGTLEVGDLVSLSVYLMTPRYFKVKNIEDNKLYIEGIYPNYNTLLYYIDYNKNQNSSINPIVIAKSGFSSPFNIDIEQITSYCMNREFEEKIVYKEEKSESSSITTINKFDAFDEEESSRQTNFTKENKVGFFEKIKKWIK